MGPFPLLSLFTQHVQVIPTGWLFREHLNPILTQIFAIKKNLLLRSCERQRMLPVKNLYFVSSSKISFPGILESSSLAMGRKKPRMECCTNMTSRYEEGEGESATTTRLHHQIEEAGCLFLEKDERKKGGRKRRRGFRSPSAMQKRRGELGGEGIIKA